MAETTLLAPEVQQLLDQCGGTPETIQLALDQAGGDVAAAGTALLLQQTDYLCLAVTLEETGRGGITEGLILGFWDQAHQQPRYLTCLLSTAALGALTNPGLVTTAGEWIAFYRGQIESLTGFNRQMSRQLEEFLRLEPFPGPLAECFTTPHPVLSGTARGAAPDPLAENVVAALTEMLERKISFKFRLRVAWFRLKGSDYQALATKTGWPMPLPQLPEVESADGQSRSASDLLQSTLVVRATPVIDPAGGMVLGDVLPGDLIAVRITDRSPFALRIGEHLKMYVNGAWTPTWGLVQEVSITEIGNVRIDAVLNGHVHAEMTGTPSLRIKCQLAPGRAVRSASSLPSIPVGMLGVGLAVMLGLMTLLVLGLQR